MPEPIDWELERFLDQVTREAPGILDTYQGIWRGLIPDRPTEDYVRARRIMEADPKAFGTQLMALEKKYQEQLIEASKRDKRVVFLQAENEELKKQLAAVGEGDSPVAEDRGHVKALELVERLRAEALEASHEGGGTDCCGGEKARPG